MGMPLKKNFPLAIFVMVVLWATNLSAASAGAVSSNKTDHHHHHQTNYDYSCSNGSTIAECFGEELEFVMDSEISTRLLQQGRKPPFTPPASSLRNIVGAQCGRPKYANCLPNPNKRVPRRDCSTYNKCRPSLPP